MRKAKTKYANNMQSLCRRAPPFFIHFKIHGKSGNSFEASNSLIYVFVVFVAVTVDVASVVSLDSLLS